MNKYTNFICNTSRCRATSRDIGFPQNAQMSKQMARHLYRGQFGTRVRGKREQIYSSVLGRNPVTGSWASDFVRYCGVLVAKLEFLHGGLYWADGRFNCLAHTAFDVPKTCMNNNILLLLEHALFYYLQIIWPRILRSTIIIWELIRSTF